jgi:Tfp pilus assembly protein PilO
MFRAFSSQTKIILSVIAVIVGAVLVVTFFILPMLRNFQSTDEAIKQNQSDFQQIQADIESLKNLSIQLKQLGSDQQSLNEMFPKREEIVGLVEGVESAIDKSGPTAVLSIVDSAEAGPGSKASQEKLPSVVPGLKNVEEVHYFLKLGGTYRQLIDFFVNLENLSFMSEISSLSMTADKEQAGPNQLLGNVGTVTSNIEGVFLIKKP